MQNSAKLLGHDLPTATEFRKQLEIRNKRLDGPRREAVSRSLSHSLGTAAQYYQAPTQRDTLATFRTIRSLIDGREGHSPTPKDSGSGQKTSDPPSQLNNSESEDELPTASSLARDRTSCPPKDKTAWKTVRAKRDRSTPPPTARPTPSPPPTPNPKRRRFTSEETEKIANYFSQHFKKNDPPSLSECREFLQIFQMDRTPKHIQDKCRTIAGR